MNKIKNLFLGMAMTILFAAGISSAAYAADTIHDVTLNENDADIPIQQIIHAGASVDLSDITYTITIAPQTYDPEPTEDGVYVYGSDTVYNSPIIVSADNSAANKSTWTAYNSDDASRTWDYTRSLTDLFGPINDTNFPQAGLYEFTITESIENGTSGDTNKWTHKKPDYLLQVLVKNTVGTDGKVNGRVFAGWTLSKLDVDQEKYVKVNSGTSGQDGKAVFESDYIGKGTLNVEKKVVGDYASTTYQFPQTITVILPSWYDESRDGAILPVAGTPEKSDGVTITRDSTNGNTIVFKTALAHGQVASLTVPVGTRYQIAESADPADGKAIDAAGLKYQPSMEWNVDDGKPSAQVSIFNGETLVKTMSVAQLQADSAALVSNDELQATYTAYMDDDYSFVFSDDPQGTKMNYRIIGLAQDHLYDDSASDKQGTPTGITFMAKNSLDQAYYMNTSITNNGGWADSALRAALNAPEDNILNRCLPSSVRDAAKSCVKISNGGYENGTPAKTNSDYSYKRITNDKFWLISSYELSGCESDNWMDVTGNSQYTFFKNNNINFADINKVLEDMNITSSGEEIAELDAASGTDVYCWWQRSAYADYDYSFMCVSNYGIPYNLIFADWACGVVPCFSL